MQQWYIQTSIALLFMVPHADAMNVRKMEMDTKIMYIADDGVVCEFLRFIEMYRAYYQDIQGEKIMLPQAQRVYDELEARYAAQCSSQKS